jgi:probable F420-dependent oxidoreductase
VRFGIRVLLPGVDRACSGEPPTPGELARHVEDRGFESLWFPEHTHIPVTPDGSLADERSAQYRYSFDPFASALAAGLATSTLRVGTGVSLLAQREPISLAKQVATIDTLLGGRFTLGVGFGWNRPELANHGAAWPERRARVRDAVLAMRVLWSGQPGPYDGAFTCFSPAVSLPTPHQSGGPPVYLGGGAGPKNFADIVEYADGWMPNQAPALAKLPELRTMARAKGRDPDTLAITFYGAPAHAMTEVDALAEMGVERVVFWVDAGSRDEVFRAVDELRSMIDTSDPSGPTG